MPCYKIILITIEFLLNGVIGNRNSVVLFLLSNNGFNVLPESSAVKMVTGQETGYLIMTVCTVQQGRQLCCCRFPNEDSR